MRSAHCLTIVNICGELFNNPSNDSKVIKRTQNKVIWHLTCNHDHMTLNKSGCNIHSAHRLNMIMVYCELFHKPVKCANVIERTRIIVIWHFTSNCDLNLEPKWWVIQNPSNDSNTFERTRNLVMWPLTFIAILTLNKRNCTCDQDIELK